MSLSSQPISLLRLPFPDDCPMPSPSAAALSSVQAVTARRRVQQQPSPPPPPPAQPGEAPMDDEQPLLVLDCSAAGPNGVSPRCATGASGVAGRLQSACRHLTLSRSQRSPGAGSRHCSAALSVLAAAAGGIVFVLLALLALRPLLAVYGQSVARTCRGVDPTRFSLPHADPRSPVHCAAYRPQLPPPAPRYLPSAPQRPPDASPVLVHYVLAMEQAGCALTFLQYVSILSAVHYHQPTAVYIHHHLNLTGRWFDLLAAQLGSQLVLRRVRDVTSVFGRPVQHYAHKADVIRLEAVLELGGLYLDSDMLMLRSMRPLLPYEAVLGEEHIGRGGGSFLLNLWDGRGSWGERLRASDGLANAVIVAVRNSSFVRDWYHRYRSFDNSDWDWHSCKLPLLMASEAQHRRDVLTLNTVGFFHVNYGDLAAFFETDGVDLRNLFAIHFSHLRDKLGDERWARYFADVASMEHALHVHRSNNFGRLLRGLVYGDTTW